MNGLRVQEILNLFSSENPSSFCDTLALELVQELSKGLQSYGKTVNPCMPIYSTYYHLGDNLAGFYLVYGYDVFLKRNSVLYVMSYWSDGYINGHRVYNVWPGRIGTSLPTTAGFGPSVLSNVLLPTLKTIRLRTLSYTQSLRFWSRGMAAAFPLGGAFYFVQDSSLVKLSDLQAMSRLPKSVHPAYERGVLYSDNEFTFPIYLSLVDLTESKTE